MRIFLRRATNREKTVPLPLKRSCAILSLLIVLAVFAENRAALASAPSEANPTVVAVGVRIRNLTAIDEVKENWQCTGLLVAKWKDPSLSYRPGGRGRLHRDLPARMWKPSFEIANETTPTSFRFVDLYAEPDGTAVYTQTFIATLSTNLDLRRFPFDSQRLPLVFQARGDDLDRTILKSDLADSSFPKRSYSGLAQWIPVGITTRLGTVDGSASNATDVEFNLLVRRNPKSYIYKFIIPLLLLVIISWVTFWLSHEEFKTKDQLGSAVSTLLIIVAFNITASSILPRTDYITYIDALLFSCFAFVIVSIGVIVGTHLLQVNHSERRALAVRRLAGVLLPLSFVVTQVILFFKFHVGG